MSVTVHLDPNETDWLRDQLGRKPLNDVISLATCNLPAISLPAKLYLADQHSLHPLVGGGGTNPTAGATTGWSAPNPSRGAPATTAAGGRHGVPAARAGGQHDGGLPPGPPPVTAAQVALTAATVAVLVGAIAAMGAWL